METLMGQLKAHKPENIVQNERIIYIQAKFLATYMRSQYGEERVTCKFYNYQ